MASLLNLRLALPALERLLSPGALATTQLYLGRGRYTSPEKPACPVLARGFAAPRNVKLQMLLKTDIPGVGLAGEVVSVAPGFARNKLLPGKLALPAIDKYLGLASTFKKADTAGPAKEEAEKGQLSEEEEKARAKVLKILTTTNLAFHRYLDRSTNKTLQQPVTTKDIVSEVRRQMNIEISPASLLLPNALNAPGEYEVPFILPGETFDSRSRDDEFDDEGEKQMSLKVKIRRKGRIKSAEGRVGS